MEHVDVDGLRIAYERVGTGPAVVLLHGALSDHRTWRPQLDDLSDEFTLVAWDAPGCGASSDPPAAFALEDYADAVAGLVRGLGLDRAHVLGLSFGGGLALAVALRHPEVTASLVLASAYAGWAGSLPAEEVAARRERAERDATRPPDEWVHEYLPGFFGGTVAPALVDELVAIMRDTRPAGMLPMLHAFAVADLRDELHRITVPTLLLYGDADVRSPLPVANDIHARLRDARLVVLEGVGHVSNLEAPDRFNGEVRRFLRSVTD